MTTMLYKAPGPHTLHGGSFDYVIVEDDAIKKALADGWFLTTPEAKAAKDAAEAPKLKATDDDKPATRDELEQQASKLGIKFDGRTPDKKMSALIEEVLKP